MIPGRPARHPRAAGRGQGHAVRPPVARTTSCPTSPPATCSARRCRRAPTSACKAKESWTRGQLVPDDIMIGVVDERLDSDDTREPGLHPRRLPPHRGPGRGPRRDHRRPPARPRGRPRGARGVVLERLVDRRVCTDCGTIYSVDEPAQVRLDLRHLRRRGRAARRRHARGGPQAPRPLRARDRAAHRLVLRRASCSVPVDGLGTADEVTARLSPAIDAPASPAERPRVLAASPTSRRRPSCAKMRAAGRVVAEMHERIRAAIRPGVTTPSSTASAATSSSRRGATSNFLGYHGYPAVICASPNDVIVHGIPGPVVLRRATSSRSTAGPSSTAGTATPPSPPASARSRPEAPAADRGHRGVARRRHRADGRRQPPRRHRPRRAGGRRGRRVLGGRRSTRPRHRPGHAREAGRAQLRASRARARS